MPAKILIVLTSHSQLGKTGQDTGYFLSEVSHPCAEFKQAGFTVDFVSPQGGKAPMSGVELEDPINRAFVEDPVQMQQVNETLLPGQVSSQDYAAIFYAGGHGTMWDFPNSPALDAIAVQVYESGGVIGAVCHGPSGLINIQLDNGEYLVAGKTVSCFTNEEEAAVGLDQVVPFLLADKLRDRGAVHTQAANFQRHVVTSDRLVTGQNPASAAGVAQAMIALLKD